MNSEFITQIEPLELPVSMVIKTEPLIVIKNEHPESEIVEITIDDIDSSDIKDIDIGAIQLREGSIKSETILEDILETVSVKTENAVKTAIESEYLIKTEDTNDDNGLEVVEGQGNLETDEHHILNFCNDLNGISIVKPEHPGETNFGECSKTAETISWEDIKEKIKVIEAPIIPVEPHEYTSLAKDKHVCNHCQHACKKLYALKYHIRKVHKDVTTIYQCLYCSFKSKWRESIRLHIIYKHKDTSQWFEYHCDRCDFKAYRRYTLKVHNLIHSSQYFYCYHCSYKSTRKDTLKTHISMHFRNGDVPFHCYICDFMTLKRDLIIEHFKNHPEHHSKCDEINCKYQLETSTKKLEKRYSCNKCNYKTYTSSRLNRHTIIHLKPEEIEYYHCYHCSYKSKLKATLKRHIFMHYRNKDVPFYCYICDFMTLDRDVIVKHFKKHSKHHSKDN